MRYKKIMILTIILAFLLAISAVSAADNATSDVVSVEETTVDIVKETTDEVVSVENDNQVISTNEPDVGTFDDLRKEINAVGEGGVLNLTKNYKYVNGSNEGIQINKAITIDGKGHALNGNQLSRIFQIGSDNVILKNIGFINGQGVTSGGAIISSPNNNFQIYNCNFSNCSVYDDSGSTFNYGGAISCCGDNITISNCVFKNNSGVYGGALDFYSNRGSIINCSFYNNFAKWGGAIQGGASHGIIDNCNFVGNYAISTSDARGGAIWCSSLGYGLVNRCNFTDNYVKTDNLMWGGAICWYESHHGSIVECIFINNSAESGGGIMWAYSDYNLVNNCSFSNNSAPGGNSICWEVSSKGKVINSYFNPDYENLAIYGSNVEIIKKETNLIVESITFNYGIPNNFSITLNEDNYLLPNKNIFCELCSDKIQKYIYLTTDKSGKAFLNYELNDLTVGTWNVTVIFEGNDNYAPCNATATITVLPPSTSLTIDDVNGTVGHEVTLVANLNSTLTVNEGIVTFFDGENSIGESNVVDSVATLTYTPSTAGEHKITAIFTSDNYLSSRDTALLTVAKADVDLGIDYIADVYYTNPSNFAVNVNSNYKPVNEGKIKYYVNNELAGTVDVYEGNANFNYVTNVAGSFTLKATYEETDNYFAKNASATFTVNKMPTTLSGESVIFDEESYKTFTTELKDNNSNGVGDQPVKIEVIKYSGESATFNGISDSNGITIYDVGRLAGGMWYVSGIYAGNNNYINSRFVDKFLVVRMNTTTEIEEIGNPKVNHNYKLKANIHDEDGKLVKEGVVQFYLDGIDIGSIDLSKNQGHQNTLGSDVLGAVNPMFEYVVGANDVSDLYLNYVPKKAGKHTLTAVYEGTTIYKASNSTTSFDVSNSNTVETSITASSSVYTVYNGGKYIVIKLKDVNGKAVNGVKVTVVLGGKTFTPTTKNGQAKVSTNGLAPVKTYKATITFKGNSKYDKSTTTAKVVVKKANPKLTAAKKTFKRTVKVKNYAVVLKTNQNKALKAAWVSLKVNKKTYKVKTNAKGQAIFKINNLVKKGTFNAVVKFAGNKYYNAKTVNTKITVR